MRAVTINCELIWPGLTCTCTFQCLPNCIYVNSQQLNVHNQAWNDYCTLRNKITNSIRNAHTKYQTNLFNKKWEYNYKKLLEIHKEYL